MPDTPTPKPKIRAVGDVLQTIWVIGIALAIPYYNWQFAKQHGFAAWIFLGEIIPTLKAIFWPIYLVVDYLT
jgi:hypothetical protein